MSDAPGSSPDDDAPESGADDDAPDSGGVDAPESGTDDDASDADAVDAPESGTDDDAPEQGAVDDPDAADPPQQGAGYDAPYVGSPIIMATVRVVTPFVFTFGLFVMFHGADSSGGGFQGGVIVGTVVLMLGIAFGIEATRDWIGTRLPVALVGIGVLAFLSAGFGSVLLGAAFLEYAVYADLGIPHASKYGIEFVELAIGLIVAGVVTGLFFAIAAGMPADAAGVEDGGESA